MIRTEREKTREVRKLNALELFGEGDTLYTNQVAKQIGVVWPVADRLLIELTEEGKLVGNKLVGYAKVTKPKKETIREKIKRIFHV